MKRNLTSNINQAAKILDKARFVPKSVVHSGNEPISDKNFITNLLKKK